MVGSRLRVAAGLLLFRLATSTTSSLLDVAAPETSAAPRVVLEPAVDAVPDGWNVNAETPREALIELTFAIKQQGLAELHDRLLRVSTPSSPEYGQHLSLEEVNRLTAPRREHADVVAAFLSEHGLRPQDASPNGDMLVATTTIAAAERLLGAKYIDLVHHESGALISRALSGYSLPPEVAAAVDFVAPTTHVPGVRASSRQAPPSGGGNLSSSALGFNTPKNLRQLYGVDTEGQVDSNKQAVTAFLEQGYSAGSLHLFWRMYCGGIACGKGEPKLVGDAVAGPPGIEAMLDIETITGIAGNVESEFWGFSGRSPDDPKNEPFLKWLQKLSSTPDSEVPKVFSTSYGEDEGSWSFPAAQRLNVEFQKAGARGISLLFAAGDEGANCKGSKFVPEGPGSSPFVTSVGGTRPGDSWPAPGVDAETAVGLSSGGFSNYWQMPDWQKQAVKGYLAQEGLPEADRRGFNTSGRAYPDISAQASDFIVIAGIPQPGVAGTSCAAPAAAGIFSLLNDLRLRRNQSTLGFLNPLIYASAAAFNDISEGSSSGCGVRRDGWPAKHGWDAVTGVGTPNFQRLAQVVSQLPSGRHLGHAAVATVVTSADLVI